MAMLRAVTGLSLAALVVTAGCSSSDSTNGAAAGGGNGGQAGASGGAAGTGATGAAAGTAGIGGSGGAGAGGLAGAAGSGGTGGAAPMCSSSADCKDAEVSYPGSTDPATTTPTDCIGGQCGLVSAYAGSYKTPKTPRSCTEICAASTYEGQAMQCSPSCTTAVSNGFGDKSLHFDPGDAGVPGSVAGQVRYQFSPLSGGYKFVEVGCSEVPTKKLIIGSNSYTYVNHSCCCVAP